MLDSSNLRKGLKLEIDGEPYIVVQFEFVKPGKGQALYKCRLKNMITGSQFDRTYRSGEKFNEANLEETEMEYLYYDGEHYCFMNTSTYEQELLSESQVAEAKNFLKENTVCNGPSSIRWVKGISNSRSSKPIRGPKVTRLRATANRQRSRPVTRSRCRRSSKRENSCGSTPGRATTWSG